MFFLLLFVTTAWLMGLAYVLMEMENHRVCDRSFHPAVKDCRRHAAAGWDGPIREFGDIEQSAVIFPLPSP